MNRQRIGIVSSILPKLVRMTLQVKFRAILILHCRTRLNPVILWELHYQCKQIAGVNHVYVNALNRLDFSRIIFGVLRALHAETASHGAGEPEVDGIGALSKNLV